MLITNTEQYHFHLLFFILPLMMVHNDLLLSLCTQMPSLALCSVFYAAAAISLLYMISIMFCKYPV